jgi:hypothetical protein
MPWLISAALAVGFLALYLSSLSAVPFHPDESSWLYMSRDFAALAARPNPGAPAWAPGQPQSLEVQYRLLNAPLTKYLIGLSWWLSGYSAADLKADWVWPQTWDENVATGHLPRPGLLLAGRLPGAVLSALSTVLIFWIGYEAGGLGMGLAAALLLGLNPLALLHGRRAMAEGTALFFSLLAVWGCLRLARISSYSVNEWAPNNRIRGHFYSVIRFLFVDGSGKALRTELASAAVPALGVGLLLGLAISSKQSALALLPAAGLAVVLPRLRSAAPRISRLQKLAVTWLALALGCGFTFWALNPILYRQPLAVAQAMLQARTDLAQRQTDTNRALFPESVTPDVASRLRAAVLEVYLRPPAVWDLPVYLDRLAPQAEAYFAEPLNRLARLPLLGALLAGAGVAGAAFSALRLWRERLSAATLGEQTVWWWALSTLGLILLTTPFDWQRYFMPLVPLACLFAALGIGALVRPVVQRLKGRA